MEDEVVIQIWEFLIFLRGFKLKIDLNFLWFA
jgi:hypothetical protein